MHARRHPDEYLETVVSAISSGPGSQSVLNQISVPLYMTDANGFITYFNQAAAEFAGREPEIGRDRWCVTWKLYTTTGEPLPHESCPMAEAIDRGEPIRDRVAVAERPDGTLAAFRPFPTPIFNGDGKLTGAVNLLVDVTNEQTEALERQAGRCRRLADLTYDRETASALGAMAVGFERTAQDLKSSLERDPA